MKTASVNVSILLIATIVNVMVASGDDKVTVKVLYESLCPDSRNFWVHQLAPSYRSLASIMEVIPIAFGHAKIKDDNSMECQHGKVECVGNRIHACIIDLSGPNQSQIVETIECIFNKFRRGDWANQAQQCVEEKSNLTWKAVYDECAMQQKGFDLMRMNAKITGRVGYVPSLEINGVASEEVQNEAEYSLGKYVCKVYKDSNRPEACSQFI